MSWTIRTLEERIADKANARAKADASRLMSSLPHFEDPSIQIIGQGVEKEVKVDSYRLRQAIEKGIVKKLYVDYVNEETKELLEVVDQVAWLGEAVEEINRG